MTPPEHERGGAVSTQLALLWSGTLALVLTGVQISLYAFASQLAMTAAEDGVRSGRHYGAESAADAEETARRFLERSAARVLLNPRTEAIVRPDGSLDVVVTGEVLTVLPVLDLPISRTATGALERPAA
ncbi:hypothetical protein GCM10010472_01360 [Pseudonocardia halophobica]|uniref:TadE-like protein n=1 Tax=Pseudonocardia halophobica TaxID=29401 RepID=A0A9W6L1J0_9PSEU|nr:hypothetical protein [Pseudonocardia halophobica]GLL10476.1 hypothetical protein GCM10017577_16160 [Pseudonocardia halophobica]